MVDLPMAPLVFHLPDEAATQSLAESLACAILPVMPENGLSEETPVGDWGGQIQLHGELGAGKTAFTRALLRKCGVTGRVKSPSYALLESYKVFNLYFYHLDFYRFSDPREWLDAGFRDLLRDDALVLIEWPERAEGLLPVPDVSITLSYVGEGRDATLSAHTSRGQKWLKKLVPLLTPLRPANRVFPGDA
jgi:tRNA threonylcarbamoyladenosine biosynthesis protein TsaE